MAALDRLHRAAGDRGCSVGIRAILHHAADTSRATLAVLEVRELDGAQPWSHRELVGNVRLVSMREGVPDLEVEAGAERLLESLAWAEHGS